MFFDRLDGIRIPKLNEIKNDWYRKHRPIQYVTRNYIETLNETPPKTEEDWSNVSKNLIHLSTAEKNYSANNPVPSYIRKGIGVLGSILSIFTITQAERVNTFVTKAWPQVFKERDQD